MTFFPSLRAHLRLARFDRHEVAGALGDLGTFLPLLVALSACCGLNFATALFFAGLFNVVTGLTFSIPMAVQPMKAIAAVAITEGLTSGEIVAAGATVSAVVLVLGVTGLVSWLDRAVPRSVVRGLQLALGLSLVVRGLKMVAGTGVWVAPDSYLTGILGGLAVLLLFHSRVVPSALVLFAAGSALALAKGPEALEVTLSVPALDPPAWSDFATSLGRAAVPQIPLTTLNSVIAVCALSADLFPDRPARPRAVAVSVGLMNLVGAPFGAMPMCHGAGGLAGQYRFGARTGGSILLLGAAKMVLAVLFGASLMSVCRAFPASLLGVMLVVSGSELALVARDQRRRTDAFVLLLTAGACLALENTALGFALGVAVAWIVRIAGWREKEEE